MKVLSILTVICFVLFGLKLTAQAEVVEQIKKFELIDTNRDVFIDKNEMIHFYIDKFDEKGERIHGVVVFSTLDTDNNDIVTFEEFLVGSISKKDKEKPIVIVKDAIEVKKADETKKTVTKKTGSNKVSAKKNQIKDTPIRQKKRDRFRRIDFNNDNVIVLSEMMNFYKGKKNKKGEQVESELMFYGLDKDDDGKLTFREYLKKIDWRHGKERLRLIDNRKN